MKNRTGGPVLFFVVGRKEKAGSITRCRSSGCSAQDDTHVIPTERSESRDLLRLSSRAQPRDLPRPSSRAESRDLLRLSSRAKPKDLPRPSSRAHRRKRRSFDSAGKARKSHASRASGSFVQDYGAGTPGNAGRSEQSAEYKKAGRGFRPALECDGFVGRVNSRGARIPRSSGSGRPSHSRQ